MFLSRESRGQRSLAGYSPWSHKELDTTEATNTFTFTIPNQETRDLEARLVVPGCLSLEAEFLISSHRLHAFLFTDSSPLGTP